MTPNKVEMVELIELDDESSTYSKYFCASDNVYEMYAKEFMPYRLLHHLVIL